MSQDLSQTQRRRINGWAMYDWANSAYVTTVAVAVLPAYFAASVAPQEGIELLGMQIKATSLWGYAVSLAAVAVFIISPLLGAMADYSASKRRMLMLFCFVGSLCTLLLLFSGPGLVFYTLALFVVAQIAFNGGNVFYDAFLPHIAGPKLQDQVSGKGFALGYLGGGIQFALALGLVAGHQYLGISQGLAARLAMAMAGLWWGGFALITFARLEEGSTPRPLPPELANTFRPLAYEIGRASCRERV